ncbi:hypothetical protein [Haloglomus salinum]|uniref:hypothetical protein n=1 Tax=Haloglomus salinum TaxID=2962673 RepID=UPI0020C9AECE|nr:hypothetical protein [Haloglomus salinum]
MVDERVTDGRRIAQLLAAELRGHERGALGRLAVTDVRDVEGSEHGEFAYGVALLPPGETADRRNPDVETRAAVERLADVYVHESRARVEFRIAPDAAADAGREAAAEEASGLRVRPKATTPPRTILFLESGVAAKRALPVFRAVVEEG